MKIGDVVCWKWGAFQRCGAVISIYNERTVNVLWQDGSIGLIYARSLLKIGELPEEKPNKSLPLPNNENNP